MVVRSIDVYSYGNRRSLDFLILDTRTLDVLLFQLFF